MFNKILLLLLSVLLLSSCVVSVKNHGYEQDVDSFVRLKQNKSAKSEVLRQVGTPSVVSTFDTNIWYYVSTKTKRISALNPQVIETRVVQLSFGKTGTLSDVVIYSMDEHRNLKFNRSESKIKGDDTNALKDFFFNFGRFNKVKK